MRDKLSLEEQRAIDTAGPLPARVKDPDSGTINIMLRSGDFDSVRALLPDEPDAERIRDQRTQRVYALVPEHRYQRFQAIFEQVPDWDNSSSTENGALPKPAQYPPELLEWARQRFDESEFAAGNLEVRETGGLKLDDFIQELEEIVAAHE